nr:Ycf21 protein [Pyropia sp. Myanmar_A]BED43313.1 Ycf21 protein [Pyropia sp. Myanmar_B]BED43510.1 Ycf21 protein [Pyropia sp. Myanmar_C]
MTFNFAFLYRIKIIPSNQICSNVSIPLLWKIILLGDGSFTRHCQIISYGGTTIRHISTFIYSKIHKSSKYYVNRRVWIVNSLKKKLIFASSWWNVEKYEAIYKYPSTAIGSFFIQSELDYYRDIHCIFCGYSSELEKCFLVPGPFWGRYYTLFHKGNPTALIYEIFSPLLENVW